MLKVVYPESERAIQFNPERFDDGDLDALDLVATSPSIPIQLRAPIGVMVECERRRRDSSEPIEPTFCQLNIIGLSRKDLADVLGSAFEIMFARGTLPEQAGNFLSHVAAHVVVLAQGRLELGWKI